MEDSWSVHVNQPRVSETVGYEPQPSSHLPEPSLNLELYRGTSLIRNWVSETWNWTVSLTLETTSFNFLTRRARILRLIDSCITQLKAQGPSRTCNESKEEVQKRV